MSEKTVKIPSISCGHCVATIKRELKDVKGVMSVEGDPASKTVTVKWEPPADWNAIESALKEIGYAPGN